MKQTPYLRPNIWMITAIGVMVASAIGLGTPTVGIESIILLNSPLMPPESGSPDTAPRVTAYAAPGSQIRYAGDGDPLAILDPSLRGFQDVERAGIGRYAEQQSFTARFEGILDHRGDRIPVVLSGPVITVTYERFPGRKAFMTDIVSMDLEGEAAGMTVLLRQSHDHPTVGTTSVVDFGRGRFAVESFYDILTDVSLDRGRTWRPQADAVQICLTYADNARSPDTRLRWSGIKSIYR